MPVKLRSAAVLGGGQSTSPPAKDTATIVGSAHPDQGPTANDGSHPPDGQTAKSKASDNPDPSAPKGANGKPLSKDQQREISELKSRDRSVRAHEAAHKAVGGSLAGGISLSYEIGPDGQSYAVGGEVSIDTGSERDPNATISKMQRVIAAALAPADPSNQDRAVAAAASAAEADAQRQLSEQQQTKQQATKGTADKTSTASSEPTTTGQATATADGLPISTTSSNGYLVSRAYAAKPNASGNTLNLIA